MDDKSLGLLVQKITKHTKVTVLKQLTVFRVILEQSNLNSISKK